MTAAMVILILIGIAACPPAHVSRPLLFVVSAIAFAVIGLVNGAALWWTTAGASAMNRLPDDHGLIQQSSGITCGAASGAMLMWRYGHRVSEGAVAEAAATNPLIGTDEFRLAHALSRFAGPRLTGRARRIDWKIALRLGKPFVAYVRLPGMGGHAILVESISGESVHVADPLTASREVQPRMEFESEWTGTAIWLE